MMLLTKLMSMIDNFMSTMYQFYSESKEDIFPMDYLVVIFSLKSSVQSVMLVAFRNLGSAVEIYVGRRELGYTLHTR